MLPQESVRLHGYQNYRDGILSIGIDANATSDPGGLLREPKKMEPEHARWDTEQELSESENIKSL
jgi:hypothetical protein